MSAAQTSSRLGTAVSLAALSGYIDGIGFVFVGGYFVSFMSGNTTRAGVELVSGGFSTALLGGAIIAAFVGGVIVGTVIRRIWQDRSIDTGGFRSLLLVAAGIAVAAGLALADLRAAAAVTLAFAMGAVNTVLTHPGEPSYGITYMTGALVKVGEGIVDALRGGDRRAWLRYAALWVSIALGAIVGAGAYAVVGRSALWFAVGGALLVAAMVRPPRRARSAR